MNFLQKLPVRQQLFILIGGILLLVLLAYQFSFRNTLKLYQTYQEQEKALALAASAPQRIQNYQTQLQALDQNFSKMKYDRSQLFEAVNTFCVAHDLTLDNFSSEQRVSIDNMEWITNPIEVSGPFWEITQLCYDIEQTHQYGHIASVHYALKKDLRSKTDKLIGTIYLQNVESQ